LTPTYLLAIDPGTRRLGVALFHKKKLKATNTFQNIGHDKESIKVLVKELDGFMLEHKVKWNHVLTIIETPAPRWYGKGNTTSILKILWQVLTILLEFFRLGRLVDVVDSFEWNKYKRGNLWVQHKDDAKKEQFINLFPNAPTGNTDTRDAALMGHWYLTQPS
jgi:hypothetical protein